MNKVKVLIKKYIKGGRSSREIISREFSDINSLSDYLNDYFNPNRDTAEDEKSKIIEYEVIMSFISDNNREIKNLNKKISFADSRVQRQITLFINDLSQPAFSYLKAEMRSSSEVNKIR